MRLGLIGCGSIGRAVATAVAGGCLPGVELVGMVDPCRAEAVAKLPATVTCPFWKELSPLLTLKPDLVVEAASGDAVRSLAGDVLACGADLMIVSVAALADAEFLAWLTCQARQHGRRVLVPSGAVGGIDIIKAAAVAGLRECRLTTTKPVLALRDAFYVQKRGIDLESLLEPTVIFQGTAGEAVQFFPQNLNVAATISLAGPGFDKTLVTVIADPTATHNVHEIFIRGEFGEATIRLVNLPSVENQKSSYLASLSVLATLRRVSQELCVGT